MNLTDHQIQLMGVLLLMDGFLKNWCPVLDQYRKGRSISMAGLVLVGILPNFLQLAK
jgi:hypothetical protein